ncbi:hypothetical protein [Fusicatenibacter sp.]
MDLGQFSIGLGIKLFLIGMIAISAMFLPGISDSRLDSDLTHTGTCKDKQSKNAETRVKGLRIFS